MATLRVKLNNLIKAVAIATCALLISAQAAHGLTLTHNNSVATFDESTGFITSWTVDGVEQLGAGGTGFFFRTGNATSETTAASLNNTLLTQGNPTNPALVTAFYESPGEFRVELRYSLLGGSAGSGFSLLNTQFDIANLSPDNDLNVSLFEYVNMDLSSTAGNDVLQITGEVENTAVQTDPNSIYQSPITGGHSGPLGGPHSKQAAEASVLLGLFTDSNATILDGTLAGNFANPAYAFGYEFTLLRDLDTGPNQALESFTVLSPKFIAANTSPAVVPEPTTAAGAVLGLLVLSGCWTRRRRLAD